MGSASATTSIASGSFDLVQKFLEHLVVKNPAGALGRGGSALCEIDWATVEASMADCQTLEQAIGRAIVVGFLRRQRPLLRLQRGGRRS
jgi:hypothetical protein